MESMGINMQRFYKNKNIIITGHTGFKGSWMSYILTMFGANVTGISLEPNTENNLFTILNLKDKIDSRIVDIRNLDEIKEIFKEVKPEIVIHLAAQPLVIDSYKDPVYTYDVNVMGTVNICECVRLCDSVKSFINVTTDKVYKNNEWCYGYRENDRLNGFDPYSNSKSCSELVTDSYKNSFFYERETLAVSTCRAGNVIGGGDFSENRIIPDCVKYTISNSSIKIRNQNSTRPYQHVLEAVIFYLHLAQLQYSNVNLSGNYNIGPEETDCITTGDIVEMFCENWGDPAKWEAMDVKGPHEAGYLKLDTSKAKNQLGWKPIWNVAEAIGYVVDWSKAYYADKNMEEITSKQIKRYLDKCEKAWKM